MKYAFQMMDDVVDRSNLPRRMAGSGCDLSHPPVRAKEHRTLREAHWVHCDTTSSSCDITSTDDVRPGRDVRPSRDVRATNDDRSAEEVKSTDDFRSVCDTTGLADLRSPFISRQLGGKLCQVCADMAAGFYCGAFVCEACKKFFIRSSKTINPTFTCLNSGRCDVTRTKRVHCQFCRYQKCLKLNMFYQKGEKCTSGLSFRKLPCGVCSAPASGFHFGAVTCEGCKGFFRRMTRERDVHLYKCSRTNSCDVSIMTRNICKACRFLKCLRLGMSVSGSRLGRQPNSVRYALSQINHQISAPNESTSFSGAEEKQPTQLQSSIDVVNLRSPAYQDSPVFEETPQTDVTIPGPPVVSHADKHALGFDCPGGSNDSRSHPLDTHIPGNKPKHSLLSALITSDSCQYLQAASKSEQKLSSTFPNFKDERDPGKRSDCMNVNFESSNRVPNKGAVQHHNPLYSRHLSAVFKNPVFSSLVSKSCVCSGDSSLDKVEKCVRSSKPHVIDPVGQNQTQVTASLGQNQLNVTASFGQIQTNIKASLGQNQPNGTALFGQCQPNVTASPCHSEHIATDSLGQSQPNVTASLGQSQPNVTASLGQSRPNVTTLICHSQPNIAASINHSRLLSVSSSISHSLPSANTSFSHSQPHVTASVSHTHQPHVTASVCHTHQPRVTASVCHTHQSRVTASVSLTHQPHLTTSCFSSQPNVTFTSCHSQPLITDSVSQSRSNYSDPAVRDSLPCVTTSDNSSQSLVNLTYRDHQPKVTTVFIPSQQSCVTATVSHSQQSRVTGNGSHSQKSHSTAPLSDNQPYIEASLSQIYKPYITFPCCQGKSHATAVTSHSLQPCIKASYVLRQNQVTNEISHSQRNYSGTSLCQPLVTTPLCHSQPPPTAPGTFSLTELQNQLLFADSTCHSQQTCVTTVIGHNQLEFTALASHRQLDYTAAPVRQPYTTTPARPFQQDHDPASVNQVYTKASTHQPYVTASNSQPYVRASPYQPSATAFIYQPYSTASISHSDTKTSPEKPLAAASLYQPYVTALITEPYHTTSLSQPYSKTPLDEKRQDNVTTSISHSQQNQVIKLFNQPFAATSISQNHIATLLSHIKQPDVTNFSGHIQQNYVTASKCHTNGTILSAGIRPIQISDTSSITDKSKNTTSHSTYDLSPDYLTAYKSTTDFRLDFDTSYPPLHERFRLKGTPIKHCENFVQNGGNVDYMKSQTFIQAHDDVSFSQMESQRTQCDILRHNEDLIIQCDCFGQSEGQRTQCDCFGPSEGQTTRLDNLGPNEVQITQVYSLGQSESQSTPFINVGQMEGQRNRCDNFKQSEGNRTKYDSLGRSDNQYSASPFSECLILENVEYSLNLLPDWKDHLDFDKFCSAYLPSKRHKNPWFTRKRQRVKTETLPNLSLGHRDLQKNETSTSPHNTHSSQIQPVSNLLSKSEPSQLIPPGPDGETLVIKLEDVYPPDIPKASVSEDEFSQEAINSREDSADSQTCDLAQVMKQIDFSLRYHLPSSCVTCGDLPDNKFDLVLTSDPCPTELITASGSELAYSCDDEKVTGLLTADAAKHSTQKVLWQSSSDVTTSFTDDVTKSLTPDVTKSSTPNVMRQPSADVNRPSTPEDFSLATEVLHTILLDAGHHLKEFCCVSRAKIDLFDDQIDSQDVQTTWQRMMDRLIGHTQHIQRFALKIPGFKSLTVEDQILLLRMSTYSLIILNHSRVYEPGTGYYSYFNLTRGQTEILRGSFPELEVIDSHYKHAVFMANRISLTDLEYAFLSAILLLDEEHAGLKDKKKTKQLKEKFVDAFQNYEIDNFPKGDLRFGELLLRLPEFLQMTMEHDIAVMLLTNRLPHLQVPELYADLSTPQPTNT